MTPHVGPGKEILEELQANPSSGLSSQQAQDRLARYGENRLKEKKKKTNLQRFFEQFKDVMILILIVAAAISFIIACINGQPEEFFEPALILLIVILNAIMGMMQESKAEKALDALKNLSAPHARVLRDGEEKVIDAGQLVPGDIIRLEAGDFIPADARLLHSVSLKCEESALTGESVPAEKDADTQVKADAALGDRSNMVFSGCSVTYGTATAVVTGTGMNTEMGKIANMLSNEEDGQTPLQKKLAELPFDSDRKLMSTVNRIDGKNIVIVKGAFDVMAGRCVKGDLATARRVNDEMSTSALRVLAIGYKEIQEVPRTPTSEELESGLTFMGLVGMIDPPRPEAREAVKTCRVAGIRPVMITGDHVVTASAIAKNLGIMQPGDLAITGAELDAMTDEELDKQVENISVYARVSPENKIRIVKAWQRKDRVVAMTGDGVNDAPALKAADIGCAMGITGTDVAKGAADMTLTDDNFATIVDAVREGRGIYANIKKVVGFLLGTNIGEVFTVFIAMLLWHKTPLLSMQLLWINLVTDSLPAIALGMEAVESDVMQKKPKPKDESIFAHGLGVRVVLQGIMFAALTLAGFVIGENTTGTLSGGQTMAFMVLSLSQIVQAYNMRSEHSLFKIGVFSNRKLNGACLISLLLVALVLFTPVGVAFELARLPWTMYLVGLGLSLVPVLVMELSKAFGLIKHAH